MTIPILILSVLGIALAVHSFCTASAMPPKAPTVYGLSVSLMAGAAVGTSVFAFMEREQESLTLLAAWLGIKLLTLIGAKLSGFPVKGITIFNYVKRPLTQEEAQDSGWHWGPLHIGGHGHGHH